MGRIDPSRKRSFETSFVNAQSPLAMSQEFKPPGTLRKKRRKASTFFGVGRNSNSKSKPWRARVMKVHLGNFRTQEEAAKRVDEQLDELGADKRYRNFINGKA